VTQLNFEPTARGASSQRRVTWVSKLTGVVICVAVVVCAAIVAVTQESHSPSSAASPARAQPIRYLGVFEPGSPGSYAGVDGFAQAVGRQPNLVTYYGSWGEQFHKSFAETAYEHGATTIVQIDPVDISLAEIAAGKYDRYLLSFANDVAAFKHQVIISFGHEMNGYWYSWGYHHTPAATFVAAWRHIVTFFRQHGADNVKWLWQVNSINSQTGPVHDWWPGSHYVTWVGLSCYYYLPGNTFDNVFNPVFNAVRQFTQDPVLIAETAVGPQAGQSRGIRDLFAGIRSQRYMGLVWFDQHSTGGLYRGENWRIEGNRAVIAAFRKALKG
jgi:mannan endo-1,4-beta-mannosidase